MLNKINILFFWLGGIAVLLRFVCVHLCICKYIDIVLFKLFLKILLMIMN